MLRRVLSLCTALGFLTLVDLPAQTAFMPVDEIVPGMRGIGYTVFEGTEPEPFRAEIIGVLRNGSGPGRSLILARLEGGPLAETGVIAGMSGSPVYVDDRLIGAVSYSLGQFAKEPIAGITPIAEMVDAAALETPRSAAVAAARLDAPVTIEGVASSLRAIFGSAGSFAADAPAVAGFGLTGADAARLGLNLRPIATPIALGGFSGLAREMLANAAGGAFAPVFGQPADAVPPSDREGLRPGDAVGVTLVQGDLELGATGTVTHVDGDRVYAFGHPFVNLGPTRFPMTQARIHTLLPSLMTSVKVASMEGVVGVVQQDRATTIAGRLGLGPSMIPVSLTLDNDRGLHRTFEFELVDDQLLTPLLAFVTIVNTLQSYERQAGTATFSLSGTAEIEGHEAIALDNVFAGQSPSIGAASYVAGPIGELLANDLAPVAIKRLSLSITSSEEPRTATLERVWLDTPRPRPGETVKLNVLLRTYRGETTRQSLDITLPTDPPGPVTIVVSDGPRLGLAEQRAERSRRPQTLKHLIRDLNRTRRSDRLYVQLQSAGGGAVVNGETLPSLPPSTLAVLEGDRGGVAVVPLRTVTLDEWELATEHAVSGSRTLTVPLDAR